MSELSLTINEITKDLMIIESKASLPIGWVSERYTRMMLLASSANELAGLSLAVAKMALFVIDEGLLWNQKRGGPFHTKEDWLDDIQVDAEFGFSRASVYATMADIRMARKEGAPWELIAKLLAKTPGALRDARKNWIDQDGMLKDDLELPAEGGVVAALEVASALSPGEARTYVGTDVGTKTTRWVTDSTWIEEAALAGRGRTLLVKIHVRDRDAERVLDVAVHGLKDRANADWVVRRLGGSGLKKGDSDEVR